MFFYQPTFIALVSKDEKSSEYVIAWKLKELFKS